MKLLADAERRNADRLIFLGDLGNDERLFETLRRLGVDCLFGNWEVSGFSAYLPRYATGSVFGRPRFVSGIAVFCHATPDMPAEAGATQDAATYMDQGIGWQQLFPRLHRDEAALWSALGLHGGGRPVRSPSMGIRMCRWRGDGAAMQTGQTSGVVDVCNRGLAWTNFN